MAVGCAAVGGGYDNACNDDGGTIDSIGACRGRLRSLYADIVTLSTLRRYACKKEV